MLTFFRGFLYDKRQPCGMAVGKHIEKSGLSLFKWKSNFLPLDDMCVNKIEPDLSAQSIVKDSYLVESTMSFFPFIYWNVNSSVLVLILLYFGEIDKLRNILIPCAFASEVTLIDLIFVSSKM